MRGTVLYRASSCVCKRLGLVGVLVVCEECSLGKLKGLLLLFCSPLLLTNTDSFAQVAGIVQDTFAGEAGEGEGNEKETTGGYIYC